MNELKVIAFSLFAVAFVIALINRPVLKHHNSEATYKRFKRKATLYMVGILLLVLSVILFVIGTFK